ncbi:hypothetical protein ACU610_20180 [Geodermatophilus sp. URMC 61]|uniref:hypothetical protein n=1 Tax=Geodermatophilus sp. URMC 61 TaxID=3423411 RepID=UPI00406CA5E7
MRMMLKAVIDTAAGNEAAREGRLLEFTHRLVEQLDPEAAYFVTENGQRSCLLVFDMADTSQIVVIAEPLFLDGKAQVTFVPCMNLEDLETGLGRLYPQDAASAH